MPFPRHQLYARYSPVRIAAHASNRAIERLFRPVCVVLAKAEVGAEDWQKNTEKLAILKNLRRRPLQTQQLRAQKSVGQLVQWLQFGQLRSAMAGYKNVFRSGKLLPAEPSRQLKRN